MRMISRPEWPHTVDDIRKSLDGVWGLVGAIGTNGNLFRLERSLYQPFNFKLTEYEGTQEEQILTTKMYDENCKEQAVQDFAAKLGFFAKRE